MTEYFGYVDAPVEFPDFVCIDQAEHMAKRFMADRPHIEFGEVTVQVLPDLLRGPMKRITWTVNGEEIW